MKNHPSTLSKSIDILHSSILFIVCACIVHVLFVTSMSKFQNPFLFLAYMILNIVIFCGFYGCAIELASGEEAGYTSKGFIKNLKAFSLIYVFLTFAQFSLEQVTAKVFQSLFNVTLNLEYWNTDIILLGLLAWVMIYVKYLKPLKRPKKPIIITAKHIVTIGCFYIVGTLINNINIFYTFQNSRLDNLPILLSTYVDILTFLYFTFIILETYSEVPELIDRDRKLYMVTPLGGGILAGMVSQLFRFYPPVFVVLKALSPKNYKTKTFLRLPWKDRFYVKDKLVAITCFTANSAEAYKIAKEFKKRGSTVIMGGPHVTYLPNEALEYCDSVVIGEAEGVWKDIVKDYENGTLQQKYNGFSVDDFHTEVHQELLNSPPGVIKDFLETTRGCKFRCHFCTIPSLSGGKTRKKPIPEIIELIKKIKDRHKMIVFIDNNIYSDPAYAKDLFKALKPLKIKWATQCTIDIAKNDETLRLAKESGCTQFLFGYEIFGGSLENQQGGKFALEKQYIKFTEKIKKMGIKIKAHFIYGFDSDNLKNALRLWFFCFRIRPLYTILSVLTPLPGSQTYHEMLKNNQITNFNWRYYDCQNLVFEPKRIKSPVMKILFPFMKYTYLLTTSRVGYFLLTFLVIDYIFFGFKHF